MPDSTIAVIGAGTMGAGIAQVAAQNGCAVILYDIKDEFVRRGLENAQGALERRVSQGKMTPEDLATIIGRIRPTTRLEDAAVADFVIEAAPEDLALKRGIFSTLSSSAYSETLLASNTSSLSITSIASAVSDPERVVGLHFFNPAPVMQLVEVVAGTRTSQEAITRAIALAGALGKTPVQAADMPGFIVNRVARPFYGEALKMLGEGSATVEQIDGAMRAAGFRMGPFELMDLIGIDINFAVTRSVYDAFFGEPRFRPHPIQQRMVEAGTIGRKSGRGFYDYAAGEKGAATQSAIKPLSHASHTPLLPAELTEEFVGKAEVDIPDEEQSAEIVARIVSMIMNEAAFAVGDGVASVADVDSAMKLGTNYPHGPLKWADRTGLDLVARVLNRLRDTLGEERYRVAPLLQRLVASGATGDAAGSGFHSPGEKGMV